MFWRAATAWLGMVPLAIANGALREAWLAPRLGAARAHVASTLLLCVLIGLYAWLVARWMAPTGVGEALALGGLWLALTLGFEFGFGRLVAGKSWAELLADYDLAAGRVWPAVLLATLFAPLVAARARGLFD